MVHQSREGGRREPSEPDVEVVGHADDLPWALERGLPLPGEVVRSTDLGGNLGVVREPVLDLRRVGERGVDHRHWEGDGHLDEDGIKTFRDHDARSVMDGYRICGGGGPALPGLDIGWVQAMLS